jgi:hypothetical protein
MSRKLLYAAMAGLTLAGGIFLGYSTYQISKKVERIEIREELTDRILDEIESVEKNLRNYRN